MSGLLEYAWLQELWLSRRGISVATASRKMQVHAKTHQKKYSLRAALPVESGSHIEMPGKRGLYRLFSSSLFFTRCVVAR